MSRKSKRHKKIAKKALKQKPKNYFDANTLEFEDCVSEIANSSKTGFAACTSFLAVGEAVSNILIKNKDVDEAKQKAQYFLDFLLQNIERNCLILVSAENATEEMKEVLEHTNLDVADAHHLSLAIKHKCRTLYSGDHDLNGIPKSKINYFKEKFGLHQEFSIVRRNP